MRKSDINFPHPLLNGYNHDYIDGCQFEISIDTITEEEFSILVKFFKNRKLVEDIISLSGNGLKLNKRALTTIMTIFEGYIPTTGTNIKHYESLCNKLLLTKQDSYKLEKKVA